MMKKRGMKIVVWCMICVCAAGFLLTNVRNDTERINYQAFKNLLEENQIEKVLLGDTEYMTLLLKDGTKKKAPHPRSENFKLMLLEEGIAAEETGRTAFPFGLLLLAAVFLLSFSRRNKMAGAVGGQQIHTEKDIPDITFNQVAADREILRGMRELADFLKNPKKYEEYGARLPKGVLLYGPPGTGKTLMARALAGEAKVPFFSVNGADFVQVYVGVGAARVREIFRKARKQGGGVIFIDEIDAIGKKRDNSHEEREQTLNALLTEMSGFSPSEGIVVLAATNRMETLDEALLRAGRFDRQMEISLPDQNSRLLILKEHSKNKPLDQEVSLENLAEQTVLFSGAQLESLLNEAALAAAWRNSGPITKEDVEKAYLSVLVGAEKEEKHGTFEEEKVVTAYHEAGHAVITYLLIPGQKITKLSVLPSQKGAAGYTLSIPEESMFKTKKQLENMMAAILAGRAAEEKIFGKENVTTGAAGDIKKARNIAEKMAGEWEMGETGDPQRDEKELLFCAYRRALFLLEKNKNKLDALAGALLQKGQINGEIFHKIMKNVS